MAAAAAAAEGQAKKTAAKATAIGSAKVHICRRVDSPSICRTIPEATNRTCLEVWIAICRPGLKLVWSLGVILSICAGASKYHAQGQKQTEPSTTKSCYLHQASAPAQRSRLHL